VNKLMYYPLSFLLLPIPVFATNIGVYLYTSNEKEDSYLSLSNVVSVMSLIISFSAILFSIYQYNKSKKISIKEQFWLRTVILPDFISELTSFFNKAIENKKSHESPLEFYIETGIKSLNALQDRAYLLGVSCEGLDIIIQNEIEEFQNEIMESINSSDEFIKNVISLSTKIVSHIQSNQMKI